MITQRLSNFSEYNAQNFGYCVLGPLVVGYCHWLKTQVDKLTIPQLFFLSRDMKITHEIWHLINTTPTIPTIYLLTSRRSVTVASIKCLEDLINLVRETKFAQPIDQYFLNRFSFQLKPAHLSLLKKAGFNSTTQHIRFSEHLSQLELFITLIWSELQTFIAKERDAYLYYLRDKQFASGAAVVDLGYSGTIQKYLSLLTEKKLRGLYIGTNANIKKLSQHDLAFDSFVVHNFSRKTDHSFFRNLPLIEYIFLDKERSLMCFEKENFDVQPIFYSPDENIFQQRAQLIEHIHTGAKMFATDWQQNCSGVSLQDPDVAFAMCGAILDHPSKQIAKIFAGHSFEDNYGTSAETLCLLASEPLFNSSKRSAIKRSKWKAAAYTLADKKFLPQLWLAKLKRACKRLIYSVKF